MPEPSPSAKARRQVAALPLRIRNGSIEILLITSRETGRWVIPKGWLKKAAAARTMAAREAFEEAGLIGKASKRPFGTYRYFKRLSATETIVCEVEVFIIEADQQAEDWPEKAERQQRWLEPEAAAQMVAEPGLAALLRRLGTAMAQRVVMTGRGASPAHVAMGEARRTRRKGSIKRKRGNRPPRRHRSAIDEADPYPYGDARSHAR
jgi:8-oxo-dGTP pyrophosphatase MutT (NUDIX family)